MSRLLFGYGVRLLATIDDREVDVSEAMVIGAGGPEAALINCNRFLEITERAKRDWEELENLERIVAEAIRDHLREHHGRAS